MKYKRITRKEAVEFLKNSKTGLEPVWFKPKNGVVPATHHSEKLEGIRGKVYAHTDAGKIYFKFTDDGHKYDIYGYEDCVSAYILLDDTSEAVHFISSDDELGDTIVQCEDGIWHAYGIDENNTVIGTVMLGYTNEFQTFNALFKAYKQHYPTAKIIK